MVLMMSHASKLLQSLLLLMLMVLLLLLRWKQSLPLASLLLREAVTIIRCQWLRGRLMGGARLRRPCKCRQVGLLQTVLLLVMMVTELMML